MNRLVRISRTAPEPEDRVALLGSLELLSALDNETLAGLVEEVEWVRVAAGELVLREGDASECMYFVAHGRLGILQRQSSGVDRLVREAGAGQPIGELGLLLDQPRSASATALRDSLLVQLDRAVFDRLIEREPSVLLPLSKRIAERLAAMRPDSPLDVPAGTLVVAASPSVELAALWSQLVPLLTQYGARCVSIAELMRVSGSSEELEPWRATRWVEAEARAGRPVFVLGDDRAAAEILAPDIDRALIIADANAGIGIGPLEDYFARLREQGVPVTLDLALVHPPGCKQPQDTAAWLEKIQPARHLHLRAGNRADLERLARIVTGKATGLALGGGGARAFAHIGAVRALREAQVPIDLVAGTNIGAVVGAQLALGWDPDRMLEENRKAWPRMSRDLSLPFVSLLGGRRLSGSMRRMFGDVAIEDLWLGFQCATVDLSWCHLVSKNSGPLRRWVRASASVPGIHPPVVDGGRLYVDGGLLENVPIRLLREAGAGTVIAIDPSPFRRRTVDEQLEEAPAGLDFLLHRVPIIGGGFPGILSLIYRALSVTQQSQRQERRALSDLYIEPPVDGFGVTDYHAIQRITEFGYEETKRRIELDGLPTVA
jgi:predicted acylesterase/phospholipase RssA/CRP-like cAMP-binding protein